MAEESKSKTQRKREHQALVALARTLVELPASQLDRVPLDAAAREALLDARRLSRGALQRQLLYVTRLLCQQDVAPVRDAVASCQGTGRRAAARLHRVERWRERLIAEGDAALEALLDAYPHADRQHVRRLVRAVHEERASRRPPRNYRALFRYLDRLEPGLGPG